MSTPPPLNHFTVRIYVQLYIYAMPRAKQRTAKGSNYKEDDIVLTLYT